MSDELGDYELMDGSEVWSMPLIGGSPIEKLRWSVKVYTLVSGNYAFRLVEHTSDSEVEYEMWGGFDQPWTALGWAVSTVKEMPDNGT